VTLPQVIAAGQRLEFDVSYSADDNGADRGSIEIEALGLATLSLRLQGAGPSAATQSQQFRQVSNPKGDILFVLDTSCSMADEQARLQNAAAGVIQNLDARGIDYQVGVTTMVVNASGSAGQLLGNPLVINPRTSQGAQALAHNFQVGTPNHGSERGFDAAIAALAGINPGFHRDDAWLTLIMISDEAEQSMINSADFVRHIEGIKGPLGAARIQVNAIAEWPQQCYGSNQTGHGSAYADAAQLSGGLIDSICSNSWNAALTTIGGPGYGLQTSFSLSTAAQEISIEVLVNGVVIPSSNNTWRYDRSSQSIVFSGRSIPSAGATVTVNYLEQC
jgi:hypothetical protein